MARKEAELGQYGTTILDYKEVVEKGDSAWDVASKGFQYLGNNLALSLPQMGITAVATVAAPVTGGASLSVPAAIYTGQTWNEMEGEKNASVAIGAGILMASFDKLGLTVATKGVAPKQLFKEGVEALTKKGMSKEMAEQTLMNASRREAAALAGNAADIAKKQIAAKQLGMNMLKAVGVGGVGEAGTEMLQEATGYLAAVHGSDKEFDWNDLNNRLISAAIAGGTLGGAISTGSAAYDAGAWADVAYRLAPADQAAASDAEKYAAEEKARFGRVMSVQEIAADAARRASEQPGVTMDERAMQHDEAQTKRSISDKITEQALQPQQLWQGATRFIFNPSLQRRSRAARQLADMFGGNLQRIHSGSSFENSKFHRVAVYKNMVPDPKAFYQSVKGQFGLVKDSDKIQISDNAYTAFNKAVDKDGKFDPNLIPENTPNRAALQELGKQMATLGDQMYNDQKRHNPELGYIQNYLMRYKGVNKGAVNKNKAQFIQALQKNGYSLEDANNLTNEIIDNNEVNSIEEAFSVTKGGIVPAAHRKRALNMSEKAEFQDFMERDMFANIATAAKSAARYTAHRDFIGQNGAVISKLLDDMQAEGVPEAEVNKVAKQMKNYLDAESGNYKRPQTDVGRAAQRIQKNIMMFTTLSSLPLATISSLVETMLISRGLRSDQIFGKQGSLQTIGKELANTMWRGAQTVALQSPDPTTSKVFDTQGANTLRKLGFYEWDVGAATVTGVSEVNPWQQWVYENFFTITGLTGFTNFTRAARASLAQDYVTDKVDTVWTQRNSGQPPTREVQEAEEGLRNLGIDVDQMVEVYELKKAGLPTTPAQDKFLEDTVRESTFNFVNEAIALPQSANRPLIYQDPRFALFTQFQGFMATFTANHIPKLWGEYVKRGTPAMKYNAFALATTMIMMGFVSQHLKDLIKYGGKTPHLDNAEYLQRGIRASGLLGTGERVLDQFFPIYEQRSEGVGDWAWNTTSGESPALGYAGRLATAAGKLLEGDTERATYYGLKAAPGLGPFTNFNKGAASWLHGDGWNFRGE